MTICQHCQKNIVFDTAIKSDGGKFIPLDQGTKKAHDCQGKYQNGNNKPKQEESKLTNFTLYPEVKAIHEQAVALCKELYAEQYEQATPDRKLM